MLIESSVLSVAPLLSFALTITVLTIAFKTLESVEVVSSAVSSVVVASLSPPKEPSASKRKSAESLALGPSMPLRSRNR